MNEKYKQVEKVIIPILTVGALLAQSTMALALNVKAAEPSNVYVATRIAFSDVEQGSWYYENIMTLVDRGVTNGYNDGAFKPDDNITRAEFTKLVITALDSSAIANNRLAWSNNVIAAADEYQINLYGSDVAAWNEKINRADMAQIAIDAMYKIRGKDAVVKENITDVLKDRKDVENSPRKQAILEAMSVGVLNGNGLDADGYTSYLPNNHAKRSEAATVVMNMLKYLGDVEGELKPIAIPDKSAAQEELPDIFKFTEGASKNAPPVVNPLIAREKDLEALRNIRCGKDKTGYFVTLTAPELPQTIKNANFKFRFYIDATPKTLAPIWTILDAGDSQTYYFKTVDTGEIAQDKDMLIAALTYGAHIVDCTSVLNDLGRIKTDPDFMSDTAYRSKMHNSDTGLEESISVAHYISSDSAIVYETGAWTGYSAEDHSPHPGNWKLRMDREDVLKMFGGLLDSMLENNEE